MTHVCTSSRIREQLARDNKQPTLSVSIGVADYLEGGKTIKELLRTADRELYGMKCDDLLQLIQIQQQC